MTVAVFGLGIIGGIWAHHYEQDGLLGASWNRSPKPDAPRWQPDLLQAAAGCDFLHLVVADPPAVEAIIGRLVPVLTPAQTVIQSSTIDPVSSARFCGLVQATGAAYVEAPFTGSKPAAQERSTVFYLGGEAQALERVEPTLARLSKRRYQLPQPAHAAALKLSMNLQIAAVTEALAEGLTFARRAGLDDDIFFDALQSNVVCSGLVALKGPKLRTADWSPQFSVKHLLKDVKLALATPGVGELPGTRLMQQRLQLLVDGGRSEEDFAALLELL
jgi:3-hydroxyisobutyrate dehydrogenase-like beta-hydroxyacid dehydrogenase